MKPRNVVSLKSKATIVAASVASSSYDVETEMPDLVRTQSDPENSIVSNTATPSKRTPDSESGTVVLGKITLIS